MLRNRPGARRPRTAGRATPSRGRLLRQPLARDICTTLRLARRAVGGLVREAHLPDGYGRGVGAPSSALWTRYRPARPALMPESGGRGPDPSRRGGAFSLGPASWHGRGFPDCCARWSRRSGRWPRFGPADEYPDRLPAWPRPSGGGPSGATSCRTSPRTRLAAGHAATAAPIDPACQPWATLAPSVATIPSASHHRASAGTASRRRAAYSPVRPHHLIGMPVRHIRRDPRHRGRRRHPDRPVRGTHRPAPRPVTIHAPSSWRKARQASDRRPGRPARAS
jgi:hypothetical protein